MAEIISPRFTEVYFHKEKAQREKQSFESAWGIAEWFGRCEIRKVQIDQIGDQQVVGVAGGRRTVFNLHEEGRIIYGVIRKQKKDGKRGQDFDYFEVWYNPEVNRWYLVNPDVFPDEYRPRFRDKHSETPNFISGLSSG